MSTEIIMPEQRRQVVAPISSDNSIMAVISRAAADPTCDIEKMERLLAMHERMQAKTAEAAFNAAMAQMQCEIPTVAHGALNEHTDKTYATLDDINVKLKPIMQIHGFAISFKVEHVAAGVNVTGILMHREGHREQTTMLLPLDIGKGRNAVQAVGSSTTYGKRYVMCALLNITTGDSRDQDDDGQAAEVPPAITENQARQLQALLDKCSEKAKGAFAGMYGTTADVAKADFDRVLGQLTKSAAKAEAENANHQ
ncbi:ERF family protein [Pseudomonas putida]|uniref:ERF family protein n=1 Tax=Pseudomonas putida TaxID=303 RepID=UPI002363661E|nr:ERF family protein [Pseudomonas putida]MDD1966147.1 ERF family protein [Pseudomonas putida]